MLRGYAHQIRMFGNINIPAASTTNLIAPFALTDKKEGGMFSCSDLVSAMLVQPLFELHMLDSALTLSPKTRNAEASRPKPHTLDLDSAP